MVEAHRIPLCRLYRSVLCRNDYKRRVAPLILTLCSGFHEGQSSDVGAMQDDMLCDGAVG